MLKMFNREEPTYCCLQYRFSQNEVKTFIIGKYSCYINSFMPLVFLFLFFAKYSIFSLLLKSTLLTKPYLNLIHKHQLFLHHHHITNKAFFSLSFLSVRFSVSLLIIFNLLCRTKLTLGLCYFIARIYAFLNSF